MSQCASAALRPNAHPLTPDLPDRTPATTALQSRRRVQQQCEVCAAPYLIAPGAAHAYHTCSAVCSRTLRSRQRTGRPSGRLGTGGRPPRTVAHQQPATRRRPGSEQRTDVLPHSRTLVHILCVQCGGLRGRWSTQELPPPGLCWRCLMRVNAGLEPGIPLG